MSSRSISSARETAVGILLNPSLSGSFDPVLGRVGFAPLIPDRLWSSADDQDDRFRRLPRAWEMAQRALDRVPIPLHGIGLSLGSAGPLDGGYLDALVQLAVELRSPWISDHLSFVHLREHGERSAAAALPVPYDLESLELLTAKIEHIVRVSPVPFLVENPAYYFQYPDQDFTEARFLNELCARTGCGILLDLHNLICNVRNLGFDASRYLQELNGERVLEIHVAGGSEMHGFWTDSHTGAVDPEVLELLPLVLDKARNVRSVTFEFHEASYPLLGEVGVLQQLEHLARIVRRGRTARAASP